MTLKAKAILLKNNLLNKLISKDETVVTIPKKEYVTLNNRNIALLAIESEINDVTTPGINKVNTIRRILGITAVKRKKVS